MKVTKLSAVTLLISDMKKSVDFYSKIPNFKIVFGGPDNQFTSFLIDDMAKSYLNLKLNKTHATDFGRIIFYVDDVDEFFTYMQNDETISVLGKLESKPQDATWGERFFHMLDPDGYRLSFATPIGDE
ncbi:Glyoxalase-like domain protein [Marine Group I thaumarchaeote SCGC AAA799-O18]|nr:Glyoxalase-like domain protein [Marine Group I thaumarchaeote SCGC AAA799-O18]